MLYVIHRQVSKWYDIVQNYIQKNTTTIPILLRRYVGSMIVVVRHAMNGPEKWKHNITKSKKCVHCLPPNSDTEASAFCLARLYRVFATLYCLTHHPLPFFTTSATSTAFKGNKNCLQTLYLSATPFRIIVKLSFHLCTWSIIIVWPVPGRHSLTAQETLVISCQTKVRLVFVGCCYANKLGSSI